MQNIVKIYIITACVRQIVGEIEVIPCRFILTNEIEYKILRRRAVNSFKTECRKSIDVPRHIQMFVV